MTQLAFCPTCGVPWGNFCPQDGTRLSGAWTCPNAPKPIGMTQAPAAAPAPPAAEALAPAPVTAAPVPATPVAAPVAAPTPAPVVAAPVVASAPEPVKGKRRTPDEVMTVVEMAAVVPEPAASAHGAKGGRKRLGSVVMDSIAPASKPDVALERPGRKAGRGLDADQVATSPGKTEPAPAAAPAAKVPKPASTGGKRRQGFSETQWFMKGATDDADLLEATAETAAYEHDATIPEDQRRQFSLQRDDEQDAP